MKTKSLFTIFLTFSLLLSQLSILQFSILPAQASGENWLTGYSYRRSLLVTNSSAAAGTNYQVQIIVVNGSSEGASTSYVTNDTIIINNKTRSDFGDVNYTDNTGNVNLDYWMETLNTGLNATFWVEIAGTLTATNQTIYVYYGKADATTASNGFNTFDFFDDFADANYTGVWTVVYGTWSESGGILSQTANTGDNGWFPGVASVANPSPDGRRMQVKMRFDDSSGSRYIGFCSKLSDTNNFLDTELRNEASDVIRHQAKVGGSWKTAYNTAQTWDFSTWYKISMTVSNAGVVASYVDNVAKASFTSADWDQTWVKISLGYYASKASFDDVFVSKYVNPEPAHSTWGSEETPPPNTAPANNACDSDATFTVNVYGWSNMTVSDVDLVANLQTVDIEVNTTGDAQTFTLRWTQATYAFSETSDANGICTLGTSVNVTVDADTEQLCFNFTISVAATPGACDVEATTTDDSSATDIDLYASEFTLDFYASLTVVTLTHSWSITPGQSNITITEGTINITVTANANFNIQVKSWNASLTNGTNTIALTNLLVHKDTLASAIAVTTTYANVTGLTNQAAGSSIAVTFVLWLTVPVGTPAGSYTFVCGIQAVQYT